jgi:hypothetical protein
MIGMMNKNLPKFLYHMLLEADFPKDFAKKLIKESCKASLVAEISLCKWDDKTRTLTTVVDEKHEEGLKAFEGVAWFKDEIGYLKKGSKAQPGPPPEELLNLNGSNLVKTIHDCPQTSTLKKDSIPPRKGNEVKVDLTHEETDGDSASQSSLSSSVNDDDTINKGPCSNNSIKGEEDMRATGSRYLVPATPPCPRERHSMQRQVERWMIGILWGVGINLRGEHVPGKEQ